MAATNPSCCDLRRQPIGLWDHRRALKRLREEGRARVDEDVVFAAIDLIRCIAISSPLSASATLISCSRMTRRKERSKILKRES
jgi:putative transposase